MKRLPLTRDVTKAGAVHQRVLVLIFGLTLLAVVLRNPLAEYVFEPISAGSNTSPARHSDLASAPKPVPPNPDLRPKPPGEQEIKAALSHTSPDVSFSRGTNCLYHGQLTEARLYLAKAYNEGHHSAL